MTVHPRLAALDFCPVFVRIAEQSTSHVGFSYAAFVKPTDIEAAALKLNPKERARLAESLLASLDSLSDADAEKLWLREAERRDQELTDDPSIGVDAAHAMRESRAMIE